MEIGPIFRALLHNKTRFFLIAFEIALTLAIVVNCVNMIMDQRSKIMRPTGMDEHNILVVEAKTFDAAFEDEDFVESIYREDLAALNALPGVKAVTALHQIPLSGGGSSTGRKVVGSESDTVSAPYFLAGPDVLETLGVELVAGRGFEPADYERDEEEEDRMQEEGIPIQRNIIVTQALADKLFPDGGALGGAISNGRETSINTIVGIVGHMHNSWPLSTIAERAMIFPSMPAGSRRARYFVRAEPGQVDALYTQVDKAILGVHEGRITEVFTLAEVKDSFYSDLKAINQLLGGIALLLVVVTSLGVIGLTSFSVTERFRQIGTRRALGATRGAILRYFLVENWLVTGVGLTLGIALAVGLNFLLAKTADIPMMSWTLIGGTMLGLWIVGLVAALAPALRGTTISPVVATRSV